MRQATFTCRSWRFRLRPTWDEVTEKARRRFANLSRVGVSAAGDVVGCFAVAPRRRVKAYVVRFGRGVGRECWCEVFFVLATNAALLFAVEMQHVAQVFSKVPDCVYGDLDAEVRGV